MDAKVKPLPELKKRVLSPKQLKQPKIVRGADGEKLAVAFLTHHGYTLVTTNLRLKNQEIDIVALDTEHNEVVFIEVKARASEDWEWASDAVTKKKLRAMESVARAFLQRQRELKPEWRLPLDFRFDIICVIGKRVEHFENVSWNF